MEPKEYYQNAANTAVSIINMIENCRDVRDEDLRRSNLELLNKSLDDGPQTTDRELTPGYKSLLLKTYPNGSPKSLITPLGEIKFANESSNHSDDEHGKKDITRALSDEFKLVKFSEAKDNGIIYSITKADGKDFSFLTHLSKVKESDAQTKAEQWEQLKPDFKLELELSAPPTQMSGVQASAVNNRNTERSK